MTGLTPGLEHASHIHGFANDAPSLLPNYRLDADKDGFVKTLELADYVDSQVPELAEKVFQHKQYPIVSPTGQGFPLVKVR